MLHLISEDARIIDVKSGAIHSWADLAASVAQRSGELEAAALEAGSRIVIAPESATAFLVDLLSAWHLGITVIVVPSTLKQAEAENIASRTRPAAWIGASAPNAILTLPYGSMRTATGSIKLGAGRLQLDTPALILMTSGTTSTPKGVVHTPRTLSARLALNGAYIAKSDVARTLNLLPMHFGHGLIGNTLTPLSMGATVYLWPEAGVAGLSQLGAVLDEREITFMSSVPAMWRMVLRLSPPPREKSLRRIHVGSAPLSRQLWEQIADWSGIRRVVNTYGITETANWIAGHSLEDGPAEDGLVGRMWGGCVGVMDDAGNVAPSGSGMIVASTPSQMVGYFERDDITSSALVGPWFVTGDAGSISSDGLLRVVGRRKNEINRGGMKVSAEEVDLLLEAHPAVHEACAFPLEDPIAGEIVAAAVVLTGSQDASALDLTSWCAERIRSDAVPARIFFLRELPRNDRGKFNRDDVRAAVLAERASHD